MIKFLLARSSAKQKGSRFPAPFLLRAGAEGTQRQRRCTNATPIFFPEKGNGRRPSKRKAFRLAVSILNGLYASGMEVPARGVAALGVAIRFGLLLLSAVAQPLAALLPYGCGTPLAGAALPISWECSLIPVYRQSPQCGERSNAAFGRQSAAKLPSHAPHGSKARLRVVSNSRGSWRSHVHRTYTAQRVQSFKLQTANVRGQGARPLAFLWGFQRGYSLWKENTPFVCSCRLQAASHVPF